jgi:HAD superfamily hydrolase (TIGR01490 family)
MGHPERTVAVPSQTVALFDLDRTLLPGSSLAVLGRMLVAEGLVSRRRLVMAAVEEVRFRHAGSTDEQVARLQSEGLSLVAGIERERLHHLARRAGNQVAAQVRPSARHLLERHLTAGHFCVVLSASPQEVVDVVTARMGLQLGVGTRATVRGGRYTGGLEGPLCYGAGKLARLHEAVGPVDLAGGAWAYADSSSDRPVLDAVANPVAVNPDRTLRRHARLAHWPIVDLG